MFNPYIRNINNKSVPNISTTSSLPSIILTNKLKTCKDNNLTTNSQYVKGNQTIMIKNPKQLHLKDQNDLDNTTFEHKLKL